MLVAFACPERTVIAGTWVTGDGEGLIEIRVDGDPALRDRRLIERRENKGPVREVPHGT